MNFFRYLWCLIFGHRERVMKLYTAIIGGPLVLRWHRHVCDRCQVCWDTEVSDKTDK